MPPYTNESECSVQSDNINPYNERCGTLLPFSICLLNTKLKVIHIRTVL